MRNLNALGRMQLGKCCAGHEVSSDQIELVHAQQKPCERAAGVSQIDFLHFPVAVAITASASIRLPCLLALAGPISATVFILAPAADSGLLVAKNVRHTVEL